MTSVIVSRAISLTILALDRSRPEAERAERVAEVLAMLANIATD